MLGLLKSDMYKIFKRMSFYVCLVLSLLSAGYTVWTFEDSLRNMYKQQYGAYASMLGLDFDSMTAKDLGITAWSVFSQSVSTAILMSVIFITIFLSSEFGSGICKAIILRGKSRVAYYLSKLISSITVPLIYSIAMCGISFAIGAYRYQGAEWKEEYLNDYIIPLGWFALVTIAWVSIICMVCFLCRSSGFSMAVNLGLATIIPAAIILAITYAAKSWFNVTNIEFAKYWVGNYGNVHLSGSDMSNDDIMTLIYTLCGWFFVPLIIGFLSFKQREIK